MFKPSGNYADTGGKTAACIAVTLTALFFGCSLDEVAEPDPEVERVDELKQGATCGISITDSNFPLCIQGNPCNPQTERVFANPKAEAALTLPTTISSTASSGCGVTAVLKTLNSAGVMIQQCTYTKPVSGSFSRSCLSGGSTGSNRAATKMQFTVSGSTGFCLSFSGTAVVNETYTDNPCTTEMCGSGGITTSFLSGTICHVGTTCLDNAVCTGFSASCPRAPRKRTASCASRARLARAQRLVPTVRAARRRRSRPL